MCKTLTDMHQVLKRPIEKSTLGTPYPLFVPQPKAREASISLCQVSRMLVDYYLSVGAIPLLLQRSKGKADQKIEKLENLLNRQKKATKTATKRLAQVNREMSLHRKSARDLNKLWDGGKPLKETETELQVANERIAELERSIKHEKEQHKACQL